MIATTTEQEEEENVVVNSIYSSFTSILTLNHLVFDINSSCNVGISDIDVALVNRLYIPDHSHVQKQCISNAIAILVIDSHFTPIRFLLLLHKVLVWFHDRLHPKPSNELQQSVTEFRACNVDNKYEIQLYQS